MSTHPRLRRGGWRVLAALLLFLTFGGACQERLAQWGIPLAYGLTGLCLALIISPTPTAAVLGFVLGCVLGAAVYNNSLKRQLLER